MSRSLWFVAGAGVGVYAVTRARRAAEALTPDGLRDRLAGLTVGIGLFTDEVTAHRTAKETQLRHDRSVRLDGGSRPPELESRPAAQHEPRQHEPRQHEPRHHEPRHHEHRDED